MGFVLLALREGWGCPAERRVGRQITHHGSSELSDEKQGDWAGQVSWCSGSDPGQGKEPLAVSMFQKFLQVLATGPAHGSERGMAPAQPLGPQPHSPALPQEHPEVLCPVWAIPSPGRAGGCQEGTGAGTQLEGGFWGPYSAGSTSTCLQPVYLLLASGPTSACLSVTKWAALCIMQHAAC